MESVQNIFCPQGPIVGYFPNATAPFQRSIPESNSDSFSFIDIGQERQLITLVTNLFKEVIEPLYGDQTMALKKIEEGKDRKCLLLYREAKDPDGLIVYKVNPSDEFAENGISNSLEIKTLFVIDSNKNSGKGIGSALLHKIEEEAKKMRAHSIHVTVSEDRKDSLTFFQKKGFIVKKIFQDLYKENSREYLLHYLLPG